MLHLFHKTMWPVRKIMKEGCNRATQYKRRKIFLPSVIQGEACFPQLSVEPTEI
jgi:hypothetical protein